MMKYNYTYNPCDECEYAFHKQNQESGMCKMCEYNELRELEDKGRLLKLPYKVGDIVYSFVECSVGEYEIVEYEIYSIYIERNNMFTFYAEGTDDYEEIAFSLNDIGVSVFTTIKEVEKSLE